MAKRQEELRRRQILTATMRCVAEEGIEGATMRRIAQRANVSTGMLTYYYANKMELIAAAMNAARAHGEERRDRVAGPHPNPRRLEALFELALVDRDEETGPWAFWIEYWSQGTRRPELHPREFFASAHAWINACVVAGVEEGVFADDIDPRLMTIFLHALLIGLGIETTLNPAGVPPNLALDVAKLAFAKLRAAPHSAAEREELHGRVNGPARSDGGRAVSRRG
jgi:AcrR family transcriptional regulator